MIRSSFVPLAIACFLFASLANRSTAESLKIIELWPGGAPGEKGGIGAERDMTKPTDNLVAGKPVIRLGNVTRPTLTIHRPPPEKDTGTTVVVCPGGGYNILALDLEGTEVCDWLNSVGVTGVLLNIQKAGQNEALSLEIGRAHV